MKKEDFIKLGLDEETAIKCERVSLEELNTFAQIDAERKSLQASIKERDKQLDALKNSIRGEDELKKQIEELQKSNKEKDDAHMKEIRELKIDASIDNAIAKAGGKNRKAIRALLDFEKIQILDDGSIKGIGEQMDSLLKAEDSKFLFGTEEKGVQFKGVSLSENGTSSPLTDTSKMTYSQLAKYMVSNPDAKIN